jgi:alpha-aminoadipate carrier protein LysW
MQTCPECEGTLAVPSDALQGEIVPCGDCGTELEILELEPLTLGIAPEVQEDWGE